MKAYALTHDGLFKNLLVTTFADDDAAKAWLDSARAPCGFVAARDVDLSFPGAELVRLHNALAEIEHLSGGTTAYVNKFATKGDAQRRCFALIEKLFQHQAPTVAAPPTVESPAAISETETESEDEMKKGKKTKAAKAKKPKGEKKPRQAAAPKVKKARQYKATVVSKGGETAKATALEMIQRKNGATIAEISEKLELSTGSAKNLVWYLRRDGHKIVVNKDSDRKPYVIS